MAKELMEIGGFITSGAEIVNHDASLSGNGTVDSPLGVVPGYNETVLWSGTNAGKNEITLSESYKNFDRIGIEIQSNAGGNIAYSEILGRSNFAVPWTDNYNTDWYMLNWYGQFSANAENNKIKLTSCRFIGYQSEGGNTICGNNTDDVRVYKIIGINRKAQ